jgi:hypothetical protein
MNVMAGVRKDSVGFEDNSMIQSSKMEPGIFSGPSPGLSHRLKTSNMTVGSR